MTGSTQLRPRRNGRLRHEVRTPRMQLPLASIPRATYRIQLNSDFRFDDVTALVPYLAALGVSHVYCSPYLRARPGSRHGYDIVDHRMLNPEIGSIADFERFVATLARHGMSHLCDVVPNHMAVMGADNLWWMDVMEHGPASAYAAFFDIDWTPQDPDLTGKVLVPVLGDPYGVALDRGEIRIVFEPATGGFAAYYFEHRFPLDPRTSVPLLEAGLTQLREEGRDFVTGAALEPLVAGFSALPPRDEYARAPLGERDVVARELKMQLAAVVAKRPPLLRAIMHAVEWINTAGDPASRDMLHELLEAQAFRLAFWRVASDEINYRRFFDINELAALRTEDARVFDATHGLVLDLAAEGVIGGLRIDHPDGLFDPAAYFARLQQRYRERVIERRGATTGAGASLYVVLEKIGAPHERLPEEWPVFGTTGYRFANVVNGVFVDARAKARLDRAWRAFVGEEALALDAEVRRSRRTIMEGPLASELAVLALRALRIARADRRTRDFTHNALCEAIKDVVACFPVYRTYVDANGPSAQDRRYVDWAVARARRESRIADVTMFDFLHAALLGEPPPGASASEQSYRDFAMHAQQFTAPVAAKGIEDTAFYRFNRLVSLNEVGSDPEQFGLGVQGFHHASADRAAAWPHTMLATSTHDNKRSEDVRARIDVISEFPAAWRLTVRRWSRMNRSRKRMLNGVAAPSRNDEYLLYQILVGTFPAHDCDGDVLAGYRERIDRYMVKAAREAKLHTSWLAVNRDYEDAVIDFVGALLRTSGENLFLTDLRTQAKTFAWFGMLNSVAMTLLKFASPGVPDIYQGTEILDDSLVDPDNRRPVDYALRQARLAELDALHSELASAGAARVRSLFGAPSDGRAKLWVIARTLALRRAHPELFAHGDYRAITATGARERKNVLSARRLANEGIIAAAGRLFASLGLGVGTPPVADAWRGTALDLSWLKSPVLAVSALTGESLPIGGGEVPLELLFEHFPGALLHFSLTPGSPA